MLVKQRKLAVRDLTCAVFSYHVVKIEGPCSQSLKCSSSFYTFTVLAQRKMIKDIKFRDLLNGEMRFHDVCVRAHVCETEREGGRVQYRLYLELLCGPLKRHSAMHSISSVYRRTLALSLDGH